MNKVQVLVATMNQEGHELLTKMNINSDAIVGNQCNRNEIEKFIYRNFSVTWLSFAERGVGLNRNNTLMRADADICMFADDDMVYVDNYVEIVTSAFKRLPDADVIIFNLIEDNIKRSVITKDTRVNYFNYLRYGTARIAVKLKSIKRNAIYFNQCFGGGTEFCHGEDNLFLTMCLKKGLKIYAVPQYIAKLTEERASSWDTGNKEKYIEDQGVLFYTISRKWWRGLCLQDAIRHRKYYGKNWYAVYKKMNNSVKRKCLL